MKPYIENITTMDDDTYAKTKKKDKFRLDSMLPKVSRDVMSLTSFKDNLIEFDTDGVTYIKIKSVRYPQSIPDTYFSGLNHLTAKLSGYNQRKKEKLKHLWYKVSDNLGGPLQKKKPQHLSITSAEVIMKESENLGDYGMKCITSFLKNFINLTSIKIQFFDEKATDQTLCHIASLIAGIQAEIEVLYIDLSGCRINDEGILALADSLRDQKKLERIELKFPCAQKSRVSDNGMISISKIFENCLKLQIVHLEFNGYSEITEKSLNAVLTNINNTKKLKVLFLYFKMAHSSDEFLSSVTNKLSLCPKMEAFGLNLSNPSRFSYQNVQDLIECLSRSKDLSATYLYFEDCFEPGKKEETVICLKSFFEAQEAKRNNFKYGISY